MFCNFFKCTELSFEKNIILRQNEDALFFSDKNELPHIKSAISSIFSTLTLMHTFQISNFDIFMTQMAETAVRVRKTALRKRLIPKTYMQIVLNIDAIWCTFTPAFHFLPMLTVLYVVNCFFKQEL